MPARQTAIRRMPAIPPMPADPPPPRHVAAAAMVHHLPAQPVKSHSSLPTTSALRAYRIPAGGSLPAPLRHVNTQQVPQYQQQKHLPTAADSRQQPQPVPQYGRTPEAQMKAARQLQVLTGGTSYPVGMMSAHQQQQKLCQAAVLSAQQQQQRQQLCQAAPAPAAQEVKDEIKEEEKPPSDLDFKFTTLQSHLTPPRMINRGPGTVGLPAPAQHHHLLQYPTSQFKTEEIKTEQEMKPSPSRFLPMMTTTTIKTDDEGKS